MASKETTEVIDLPINEKFGLSIKEASAFFGIGIKKMRRLAEDPPKRICLLQRQS